MAKNLDLRKKIIELLKQGLSIRAIAIRLLESKTTVGNIVRAMFPVVLKCLTMFPTVVLDSSNLIAIALFDKPCL